MPPWHADPAHGEFLNDRRLSDAGKDTIARWVAAGAPEGDPRPILPAQPKYADGWMIGQPDAILSMQEDYPMPADGTVDVSVLRSADQLRPKTLGPGVRSAARQPRRRASCDRVHAAARAAAAGAARTVDAGARSRRRGPRRSSSSRRTWRYPPGQTGGTQLPPDQRKPAGPNDRPAPRTLGPSVGAYVPGHAAARLPGRHRDASAAPARRSSFQMHYTPTGKATTRSHQHRR